MSEGEHNRILAIAARKALAPLGFWRKGRSRVWLADRGFWLSIVEFQPSGFAKGSYLNVAAHWLWGIDPKILSFDYVAPRQKPWIKFRDAKQFEGLAEGLARQAADESRQLAVRLQDIASVAALLASELHASEELQRGGWPMFNAAVACGMNGDMETARSLLRRAYESICAWRADLGALVAPYVDALESQETFVAFIAGRIDTARRTWGKGLLGA